MSFGSAAFSSLSSLSVSAQVGHVLGSSHPAYRPSRLGAAGVPVIGRGGQATRRTGRSARSPTHTAVSTCCTVPNRLGQLMCRADTRPPGSRSRPSRRRRRTSTRSGRPPSPLDQSIRRIRSRATASISSTSNTGRTLHPPEVLVRLMTRTDLGGVSRDGPIAVARRLLALVLRPV